jgi:hypothetical protein
MAISSKLTCQETSGMPVIRLQRPARPGPHFDYRGDVIASDAKRLRFWSRLRRAPTPVQAHSPGLAGYPDSA